LYLRQIGELLTQEIACIVQLCDQPIHRIELPTQTLADAFHTSIQYGILVFDAVESLAQRVFPAFDPAVAFQNRLKN
jgi:hypothetical protein